MKKLLLITASIISCTIINSHAGHKDNDRGWATTGKILTGAVVAGTLLNHHNYECHHPQPIYHYHHRPIWIPGYYATIAQQVWVQDPPTSIPEIINGQIVYRMVQNGHWQTVYKQVWVDGYWQY